MTAWQRLDDELDAWRAAGRRAELWCRDDDACRDSAALQRLLEITEHSAVPVAVAVIPALTESSLVERLGRAPNATILQHGYAHRNHAPPGARNWELGVHRPVDDVIAELEKGRSELGQRFGHRFAAILVPPWNRIDPEVIARLPDAGFHGLSTFGARTSAYPVPNLVQCNTHVDLIAWRRGRSFIGVDAAVERLCAHLEARREATVDPSEATGILTHHLDLDNDAWEFLAELFARTRARGTAEWIEAEAAFGNFTCAQSA